jgi:hypothetical protein
LGPIQEYGDNWNIEWNPEKHRKKIAELKDRENAGQ